MDNIIPRRHSQNSIIDNRISNLRDAVFFLHQKELVNENWNAGVENRGAGIKDYIISRNYLHIILQPIHNQIHVNINDIFINN